METRTVSKLQNHSLFGPVQTTNRETVMEFLISTLPNRHISLIICEFAGEIWNPVSRLENLLCCVKNSASGDGSDAQQNNKTRTRLGQCLLNSRKCTLILSNMYCDLLNKKKPLITIPDNRYTETKCQSYYDACDGICFTRNKAQGWFMSRQKMTICSSCWDGDAGGVKYYKSSDVYEHCPETMPVIRKIVPTKAFRWLRDNRSDLILSYARDVFDHLSSQSL